METDPLLDEIQSDKFTPLKSESVSVLSLLDEGPTNSHLSVTSLVSELLSDCSSDDMKELLSRIDIVLMRGIVLGIFRDVFPRIYSIKIDGRWESAPPSSLVPRYHIERITISVPKLDSLFGKEIPKSFLSWSTFRLIEQRDLKVGKIPEERQIRKMLYEMNLESLYTCRLLEDSPGRPSVRRGHQASEILAPLVKNFLETLQWHFVGLAITKGPLAPQYVYEITPQHGYAGMFLEGIPSLQEQ